jgi:hypothetical protein
VENTPYETYRYDFCLLIYGLGLSGEDVSSVHYCVVCDELEMIRKEASTAQFNALRCQFYIGSNKKPRKSSVTIVGVTAEIRT